MRQLFVFLSLSLLVGLTACQDHLNTPSTPRYRISQFRVPIGHFSYLFTFQYRSDGRLATIVNTGNSGPYTYQMQYNAQGQLTRVDGTSSIPNIGRATYKTYEYDGAGNVTTTKLYYLSLSDQTYELYETRTLTYNSDKLPVTSTRFVVPGASTYTYTYTYMNGNQTQTIINSPGQPTTTYSEQFDNTPNPLYGLIGMPEGYDVSVINRNNVVGPNRKATYGSNGLISTLVIGPDLDAAEANILTFTYETY